jgi:hypothetical protein
VFSWHYDKVPPPQLSNGGQRLAMLLKSICTATKLSFYADISMDIIDATFSMVGGIITGHTLVAGRFPVPCNVDPLEGSFVWDNDGMLG